LRVNFKKKKRRVYSSFIMRRLHRASKTAFSASQISCNTHRFRQVSTGNDLFDEREKAEENAFIRRMEKEQREVAAEKSKKIKGTIKGDKKNNIKSESTTKDKNASD
jgi:hypothetical protein